MKVLALCGTVALSQTTGEVFETTTVNPVRFFLKNLMLIDNK